MSTLIKRCNEIKWLPSGGILELVRCDQSPPLELTTPVHSLCFLQRDLLMVRHKARGWDIPGGHREPGESLEAALSREIEEEANATVAHSRLFAHFRIYFPGSKPLNYPYPHPESFMACFLCSLSVLKPFSADFETVERRLFSPTEVRGLEWYRDHSDLYELALGIGDSARLPG